MFAAHFVFHVLATSIDPSADNPGSTITHPVRQIRDPETMHCHIVQLEYKDSKTKHCWDCDRLVDNFDHHCIWLNNCVGGKNYWFFFNCAVSAFLGILLLTIMSCYILIAYFIQPWMQGTNMYLEVTNNLSYTWFAIFPEVSMNTKALMIVVIVSVTAILGLIHLLMLGHLLGFHLFLRVLHGHSIRMGLHTLMPSAPFPTVTTVILLAKHSHIVQWNVILKEPCPMGAPLPRGNGTNRENMEEDSWIREKQR
ncbi:hypothetical protein FKM82_012089 [Ascaphus truei]